ncbi:hypothetical protein [Rhizobium laguerreae]|uniref:Uncharacterized protein n=1 Tax=Rhizobium laguerreae TaxID=1076926 RepID=A0A7Y2RBB1_9HYPH|nr:hypothetical protein [Rhizobium laguerreae]NNH67829.1 hypothetical protein [Rhizobium laguerreae]
MTKFPDTNPVPDSVLKAFNVAAWAKLEAVIAAALEAAAKGEIEISDAESVIRAGITKAKMEVGKAGL